MQNFNQRDSFKINGQSQQPLRNAPSLSRKLSKRREAQEEKNIVLDLFKDLIGQFNQEYLKVISSNRPKNIINKNMQGTKLSKKQSKLKVKQPQNKQLKNQEQRKNSEQEIKVVSQKREQVWSNYQVLMAYEIMNEEQMQVQQHKIQ